MRCYLRHLGVCAGPQNDGSRRQTKKTETAIKVQLVFVPGCNHKHTHTRSHYVRIVEPKIRIRRIARRQNRAADNFMRSRLPGKMGFGQPGSGCRRTRGKKTNILLGRLHANWPAVLFHSSVRLNECACGPSPPVSMPTAVATYPSVHNKSE